MWRIWSQGRRTRSLARCPAGGGAIEVVTSTDGRFVFTSLEGMGAVAGVESVTARSPPVSVPRGHARRGTGRRITGR